MWPLVKFWVCVWLSLWFLEGCCRCALALLQMISMCFLCYSIGGLLWWCQVSPMWEWGFSECPSPCLHTVLDDLRCPLDASVQEWHCWSVRGGDASWELLRLAIYPRCNSCCKRSLLSLREFCLWESTVPYWSLFSDPKGSLLRFIRTTFPIQ